MTIFLLIRHAAHGDVGERLSGRLPGVLLGEAGRDQAAALGERLGGERLTSIRSSPRERTMATAAAVARPHGLGVTTDDALDEIDFGAWTDRTFASLAGDPAWDAWNAARGSAVTPGGERMADAQARIVHRLRAIAADEPDGRIAIVTHGDMIRAAVCHMLALPLDHILRFDVDPASVTRIVLHGDDGRVLSLNEGNCR